MANVSADKIRTPLGKVLFFEIDPWHKDKIRKRLKDLGLTDGKWRTIYERTEAHLLPAFVKDVIVEELPQTAQLFEHPEMLEEGAALPLGFN